MLRPIAFAASLLLLALSPQRACARQLGVAPSRTADECAHAARLVRDHQPARLEEIASGVLFGCGGAEVGETAAAVSRAMRAVTDPDVLLERLSPFYGLNDSIYLRATEEIARDARASIAARVIAIRTLLGMATNWWVVAGYVALATGGDQCGTNQALHVPIRGDVGLPADVARRVRTLLAGLASDAASPAAVRSAARCAGEYAR